MATAFADDLYPGAVIEAPAEECYDYDEIPTFPARVTGVKQTATGHQITVAYLENGEPYAFDLAAGGQVVLIALPSQDNDDDMFRLEVHICDQRRSYVAAFANEASAVDFIARKGLTCAFHEVASSPIPDDWNALYEILNPTCDHGLSAHLCYGPAHYASDAEIAMGY